MASTKRQLQTEPQHQLPPKKAKLDAAETDSPNSTSNGPRVTLNSADCNLDFDIQSGGLRGSALYEQGFAYCWSGARANVGIMQGKYCFGCKIISDQPVSMEDTPPDQQHVCRIGISRGDDAVGNLGESSHSFGFGGTGKFSAGGKFVDYGEKFGAGGTIVCAVDLESKPWASIGFSKNGKWLGTARQFNAGLSGLQVVDSPVKEREWESALFPHILLKNVMVELQFSVQEGLVPEEGYRPWASALDDGNAIMGPVPSNISDCEVMMMVGLPASGKSTWAEKWVKEHPEKRYVLLGTNLVLDQMKVPGLLRKSNYGERFDCLMGQANSIFDTLLSRAARTPRNYIIDQTNVFKGARKRKLRPFAHFHKIAVVVFPKPEELNLRADKRFKETGKNVPDDVLNNMLANYVLPMSKDMPASDEFFDQVNFVELGRGESERCLEEMKCGLKANYTSYSRESSIGSYTWPPLQNEGALSAGDGHWRSSQPPPPSMNCGFQITNQVNAAYSSRECLSYQNPGVPIAPTPTNTGNYSGSHGAMPLGAAVTYPSYGVVEPYGRPNNDGENAAFGAASTSGPYGYPMVRPCPVGTVRNSTFTCNTIGGPQATPQAPRAPTLLPPPATSLYDKHYGNPLPSWSVRGAHIQSDPGLGGTPTPTPRPPHGNFPSGVRHYGGYPPHPRYY